MAVTVKLKNHQWSIKNVREMLITRGFIQYNCAHPKETMGMCAG